MLVWTKQVGAKDSFRNESQLGHGIGPSTTVAYEHSQNMRQKKDVVYGLLFLLHDLADFRFTKPI